MAGVRRVLLVENDETDAAAFLHAASSSELPLVVERATTLAGALDRLGGRADIDCVVLDLTLPDSRGIGTFYRLRQLSGKVPVVVLTGLAQEEVALQAIGRGAAGYLVKGELGGPALVRTIRVAALQNELLLKASAPVRALESAMDSIGDGVVVLGEDRSIVYSNAAARRMLGDDLGDEPDASVELLMPDQETPAPEWVTPLERAARGETVQDAVFFQRGVEGPRWVSTSVHQLPEDRQAVVTMRDVSEREQHAMEQERLLKHIEAAAELKQKFIEGVSHELRTPLTPMLGYAHLLRTRSGPLTPRQQEYIGGIVEAAERLARVVDSMLEFRDDEAGETVEIGSEDLRGLVEDCLLAAREKASAGVKLVADFHPEVPSLMHLDATRVRWILEELVGNAVNHTSAGRVLVGVRQDGPEVVIDVRDTGTGIADTHLDFVFDAFYQVDPGVGPHRGGLGLGLARARTRARAMGGSLKAESVLGDGSTFTLRFPCEWEVTT